MKRKILFLSYFIITTLCACSKEFELKNLTIREKNEPIITNQRDIKKEIINDDKKELPTETPKEVLSEIKPSMSKEEIIKEEKPTIIISKEKQEEDDTASETSIDYKIHKGRIDCLDESSCMDISLPIQFAFKDNISNTFYLEVISKSDKLLGYFIEYVFIDKTYPNNEECENNGKKLQETLKDRITSYECIDNTLKINTDY